MLATEAEVKRLLDAGVHFGHRTDRWNPKMKEFIFGPRNGIYILDLSRTAEQVRKAADFLRDAVAKGGKILFVGTKKPAQEVVKELAERTNSHYVNGRWLGGTLTNLTTIRRSVGRLKSIEDKERSGAMDLLPKKESATLRREKAKLARNLAGVLEMDKIPAVMVVVDLTREEIAVREAHRLNIPVVALADTNADPEQADIAVPCNDDAIRSIRAVMEPMAQAIEEGRRHGATEISEKKDKEKKGKASKEKEAVLAA
ncbi:MAG: 30S ribosomal protein S2 [Verrucomicrobia bacterium]|jgi:small subunit ribosomal protein S2|nr:30S ribosomal protein S2 [Verrucomicrobiota bacterium]